MNQISLAMFVLRYDVILIHTLLNSLLMQLVTTLLCYWKQTPLLLEINTHRSKLRDFVEKIVKAKLGMNFPLIMHGPNLLYEVGDDLDESMVANYAANLEKV